MFRTSVISLALIFSVTAAQAAVSCNDYVKAFNEYTQKVDGLIVKKHSIFEMTDWSRNSRFQGFVLTEKAPVGAEVILETKASAKAKPVLLKTNKTSPFVQDTKYRVVGIDVNKHFDSAPQQSGTFTVKVLASGKEICSEKKLIYNDGD